MDGIARDLADLRKPDAAALILIEAKSLIYDEQNWTRGTLARRADGKGVSWESPRACRYCALGAARISAQRAGASVFVEARVEGRLERAARQVLSQRGREVGSELWAVPVVNDEFGHAVSLEMFDIAIAEAA